MPEKVPHWPCQVPENMADILIFMCSLIFSFCLAEKKLLSHRRSGSWAAIFWRLVGLSAWCLPAPIQSTSLNLNKCWICCAFPDSLVHFLGLEISPFRRTQIQDLFCLSVRLFAHHKWLFLMCLYSEIKKLINLKLHILVEQYMNMRTMHVICRNGAKFWISKP